MGLLLLQSFPLSGRKQSEDDAGNERLTIEAQARRRAIFLDRDGTLNKNREYLIKFEEMELVSGVIAGLLRLQKLGYTLFVVSNQSGVARGYFSSQQVEEFHQKMGQTFRNMGIIIEEFAFCPHHPNGSVPQYTLDCPCRKPKPGMLLTLAAKYHLDLGKSYMVGDMQRDAMAGVNAGTIGVLLKPDGDPEAAWDRVDNPVNIKEFVSLTDFAESLTDCA